MSSYASATADFPRFGLPAAATAAIATEDIQGTLDAISSEFDGYFAGQYALPLRSYPAEVTRYVCWCGAYELMSVRGYNPEGDNGLLEKRDAKARAWLRGVAAGTISPPGMVGADGLNEDLSGAGDVTSDPPRGWQNDPPNNTSNGNSGGGGFWGN